MINVKVRRFGLIFFYSGRVHELPPHVTAPPDIYLYLNFAALNAGGVEAGAEWGPLSLHIPRELCIHLQVRTYF